jgi:hypothetical protein
MVAAKIKNTTAGSIYLDIIIENKMALAIFFKQIKGIMIGKVLKLSKFRVLHSGIKSKLICHSKSTVLSLTHLNEDFLTIELLNSSHELFNKLIILLPLRKMHR